MPSNDFSNLMKKDWNERAAEDAFYYIHSAKRNQTEEEFDASGKESVDSLIVSDLSVITSGKEPSAMKVLEIGYGIGRMTKHLAAIFGAQFDEVFRLNNLIPLFNNNAEPYNQCIYSINIIGDATSYYERIEEIEDKLNPC